MLHDFFGGVALARRRWRRLLPLAALITAGCLITALVLSDVLSQYAVLRGGQELRERQAVTFTPYYQSGGATEVSSDSRAALLRDVEAGEAYAAVIYNLQVNDPDFAGGLPTMALIGDAVVDIFPALNLCQPAPCAMRGEGVTPSRAPRSLQLAGYEVPVSGSLPASATYFDPNVAGLPLNDRLLVRLPPAAILTLDTIEAEEAITKTVLLEPSQRAITAFIESNAQEGLVLVPHDIATEQPARFEELMLSSALYLVGAVAFMALVVIAFGASTTSIIRRDIKSFTIRRMYGARPVHTAARVGGFLSACLAVAPLPLLFLLGLGSPTLTTAAGLGLGLIVAVTFVLWGSLLRKILTAIPGD